MSTATPSPVKDPEVEAVKRAAFAFFSSHVEFFVSNRAAGEVALVVATPKERRFALVSAAEAVASLAKRGVDVAATLAQAPEGPAGSFWLVADMGALGWAYLSISATNITAPTVTNGAGRN